MYAFKLARRHYVDALLVVLGRMGGTASAGEAQDAVRRELDRYMTEVDLGGVPSNPDAVRWRVETRFARQTLVDEGLLLRPDQAGWGIWTLTDAGRAAVPAAKARLSEPSLALRRAREGGTTVRVPATGERQLAFLGEALRRAHETPLGARSHPALYDVVLTLERLLQAKLAVPAGVREPATARAAAVVSARRPTWAPPVPTSTVTPNHLDERKMRAFMDGPWLEATRAMHRASAEEKALRATDLDLLASLPAVTCLVAVRSGWLSLAQGAALATRSFWLVLMDGLAAGGLVGKLSLKDGGPLAETLREGLFHRTLTGWVQHLDAAADESLALRTAPLRGWLNRFRTELGEPTEVGPRQADPLWAWLFEEDPTYEPPREDSVEDLASALAVWLASTSHGTQDPPARGALLWHPRVGWGVALGDSRNRFDAFFSVYLAVSSAEHRLKGFSQSGWVDVDRAVAASGCSSLVRDAARHVGDVARQAWGG